MCAALYVDFMEAFDTVDHRILLVKLWKVGIWGVPHQWFPSYSTSGRHSVRIGGYLSDNDILNNGVPQGSVIGPILFLIYKNDSYLCCFNGKPTSFADDSVLTYCSDSKYLVASTLHTRVGAGSP